MSADPLSLVGQTIAAKYRVEALVGKGGFAVVYRATHLLWNRPVAIKVFVSLEGLPAARREALRDAFVQEGALLAELSERSSAICQARDIGMMDFGGDAVPYMVLEWLEGRDLAAIMDAERAAALPPRTLAETIALLDAPARALALAHARGIAHRDVKPANLFVIGAPRGGEFSVKLLDFGIAKVVQDVQKMGSFKATSGVMTSFTPTYGAPEQFERHHGATGPWTDVFALALIAVELLSGREALEGETLTQLAVSAGSLVQRPTPRSRGAALGDAAEAVFVRALAVSPDQRFPDAGAFWAALMVAAGVPAPAHSSASQPYAPTALAPPASPAAFADTASPLLATPLRSTAVGIAGAVLLASGVVAIGAGIYAVRAKRARASSADLTGPGSQGGPGAVAANAPLVPAPPSCPDGTLSIPAGRFFMGSDEGPERERPAHPVEVSAFCMDATEVTTAAYQACREAGRCKRAGETNDWPGITAHDHAAYDELCNARHPLLPKDDPAGRGDHPINCVTWEMADLYCTGNGKRLPTEAEWEFAALGPDGRRFPWGDDAPTAERLNACGEECVVWAKQHGESARVKAMYKGSDGFPTTAPVGSFPLGKSRYGVLDVAGNVFEWVHDFDGPYPTRAPDGAPLRDPKGAEDAGARVMRGGAWNGSDADWLRPSYRFAAPPTLRSHGIGFRCAKSLP